VGNPVSLSRFLLLFPFDDLHPARLSVASRGNANGERKTSNFMKLSGALILEVIVLETMSHMPHRRFGDKLTTSVSNLVSVEHPRIPFVKGRSNTYALEALESFIPFFVFGVVRAHTETIVLVIRRASPINSPLDFLFVELIRRPSIIHVGGRKEGR